MSSKRSDRREFLKRGAALTGGLGLASTRPASGHLSEPEGVIHGTDAFGLDFHIAAPLRESVGVITPSSPTCSFSTM